ncbi:ATP-binding protein [Brevibacillus choshinensis]|uniref:ATP-binding protein n=1 Tax=Brevibacillus choshinensis TaxID=54911 RepID=A0ABX7FXZ8_BRECH|nr:ATP-binding protein [Brevibacillus choshinensis]
MGLSIAKRLMEAVKGTIHLESKEHKGTSVFLHFQHGDEKESRAL